MSVLIHDMEMPESCFQCMFRAAVDPETILCLVSRKRFEERFSHIQHRDKSCPLINGSWYEALTPEAVDLLRYLPYAVNSLAAKLNERMDTQLLYGIETKEGGQ